MVGDNKDYHFGKPTRRLAKCGPAFILVPHSRIDKNTQVFDDAAYGLNQAWSAFDSQSGLPNLDRVSGQDDGLIDTQAV